MILSPAPSRRGPKVFTPESSVLVSFSTLACISSVMHIDFGHCLHSNGYQLSVWLWELLIVGMEGERLPSLHYERILEFSA